MAASAAALIVIVATAFAVHELKFQLDGDTSTEDIAKIPNVERPFDWDSLFTNTGSPVPGLPPGFTAAKLVPDFQTNPDGTFKTSDGTTFTGGSKDTLDINVGWRCVGSSNVTNKGDITNAYASQYIDPTSNDRIIYFGMEKYVPQGTNNVGIWFLQDGNVGCPEATTSGGNGTLFSGAHVDGDLLIVSAFDNGGSVSNVQVYSWQSGALVPEPPNSPPNGSPADCRIVGPGDPVCGVANGGEITIQWPHASNLDPNKQPAGSSSKIPSATFFEGGINISKFPSFKDKCFTRFLFDTRSATSPTATLYDYTLGSLNTCGMIGIEKKTIGGIGSFNFTSSPGLGTPADVNGNFSLTTTATINPASKVFERVQPGTYVVRELVPADWKLTGLQCTADGAGTTAGQDGTDPTKANITIGYGGAVDCVFEDTPKTPKLTITKTPDAASVSAGDPIGFTVTLSNSSVAGTGTAKNAKIDDLLPGGTGTGVNPVTWAESPDSADCTITGAAGSQRLTCGPKELAPGASISVHLVATTAADKCGQYDNTANFTADGPLTGSATASIKCLPPKLTITKTADATPVNAGDPIGFTVTLGNSSAAGTGTAKGAKIDDDLPGGTGLGVNPVTWIESPDNPDCTVTGTAGSQHLSCGPKDLAPGAGITVHLTAATAADKCGRYDNTATFTTTNDGTGSASASIVCQPVTLTITKTADAASVSAGDPIGFTVTLANNGTAGTARNAKIDDDLPGGAGTGVNPVTWIESPDSPDCAITGTAGSQHLTCGPKDLGPGASITVHLLATTAADKCGQYDNTARYTTTNDGSGSASASIMCRKPDLTITKVADAASVDAGDPIGFTVTLTNNSAAGTGTAKGARIDDDLPAGAGTGVNPVTWTESPDSPDCSITGTIGSQHLTCGPKDLAPGGSISVHLVATTAGDKCGQYDNTARFTTTNNGSGSATASITCKKPNLALTKTADGSPVNAGDPIGFTVTLANSGAAGTGTAKGAKIDDDLPGGTGVNVNPVTWTESPDNPDCSITGAAGSQHLTCGPKDLAPGASISVHLVATTAADKCGQYDNTARFTSTNDGSGSTSASITCQPPKLTIAKTADATSVSAGDAIGFTVTLTNSNVAGTGAAKGAKIDDDLPGGTGAGVLPVTWTESPDNADCNITGAAGSQHLTCGPKDLAPGGSISVHLVATTAADKCGQYDNIARFTTTNDGSGSSAASITCLPAKLTITKTADAGSVNPGDPIGFTVTLTNSNTAGTGTARGAKIDDDLPGGAAAGVNPVTWSESPDNVDCTITGAVGSQHLTCGPKDLAPGGSISVHVTATTAADKCGQYDNTARFTTTNDGSGSASASITCQSISSVQHLIPRDSATVGGSTPTGTVHFQLFGPTDATCSGTPVYETAASLSAGTAKTPDTTIDTATYGTGTFRWKVHYDGDFNNPPADSPCGVEAVSVTNG